MEKLKDQVSGKTLHGKAWFHSEEYQEQRDSLKSVDENEVLAILNKSSEVDASHVRVYVDSDTVTLAGIAENVVEAKAMKKMVERIPGVSQVISELQVVRGTES